MSFAVERVDAVDHLAGEHGFDGSQTTTYGLLLAHCLAHGDVPDAGNLEHIRKMVRELERSQPDGWLARAFDTAGVKS
jgi:hypothetical protein